MGNMRPQSANEKRYNHGFNAEGLRVSRSHIEALRHSEGWREDHPGRFGL